MILLYLDPGSGSMLIQLIIAAVAGAGIAVVVGWKRIKGLFAKKEKIETIDEEENDQP